MKSIISKVENLIELVSDEINKREDFYSEKSEKWQESEKGEKYQEQTDSLSELLGGLEQFKDELED